MTPEEIKEFEEILKGIDKDELDGDKEGWWETSTGVEFGTKKLKECLQFLSQVAQNHYQQGLKEGERIETVICAAVKADDGTIYACRRHGHGLLAIQFDGKKPLRNGSDEQQGFLTTRGRYVSRAEGRKLQDAAGIPSADKGGYRAQTLFSEDLY